MDLTLLSLIIKVFEFEFSLRFYFSSHHFCCCEPVWPSGKAGKQRDLGSSPLRLNLHPT